MRPVINPAAPSATCSWLYLPLRCRWEGSLPNKSGQCRGARRFPCCAGNPLPEVFYDCICPFRAVSHQRPTVILQLDDTSRPFSSFVISCWSAPNLQQTERLLVPRRMPWHSILLSFFLSQPHQPLGSSSISCAVPQPSLLQMPPHCLSPAGFMARSYFKGGMWELSPKHSTGWVSQIEQHCFCSLITSLLVVFVWLGPCPPGKSSFSAFGHLYDAVAQLRVWDTGKCA